MSINILKFTFIYCDHTIGFWLKNIIIRKPHVLFNNSETNDSDFYNARL